MKKRNASGHVLLILTALFLCAGSLALTFFPAARYSPTENRLLADIPRFSANDLQSGAYTAAWDSFATERFPARGVMRRARAALTLALGEREVHGVILCRDGSLSRRIATDERAYRQNLDALVRLRQRFSGAGLTLTIAIAPCRIEARAEVLPSLYDAADRKAAHQALADRIPDALTFEDLTDDAFWYRTDHHWTTAGAYAAYCRIADAMGFTPFADFSQQVISSDFYGTSDAAAGIPFVAPDSITLYRYAGDGAYRVTRDGKPAAFTGLYDFERLATRDQYAAFLGGNCGVLTVDLGEDDARPTLLLIRDSFADSVIPFLARHFRIVAVDPRYRVPALATLAANADRVLVLCGMQSICNTVFFSPLLRA